MALKKIVLVGGGGHCRSCIETIESTGKFEIIGIIDVEKKIGDKVFNYNVIGSDNQIKNFISLETFFLITVGQIKSSKLRKMLSKEIAQAGGQLAIIISPFATVSKYAQIGTGTIVLHKAVINAGATVGDGCIINTGAIVEHDAKIGEYTHVSTMACINGDCKIGCDSFIGSNAVVNHGISISNSSVIGSGSVIHRNIYETGIYAGNPFKKIG